MANCVFNVHKYLNYHSKNRYYNDTADKAFVEQLFIEFLTPLTVFFLSGTC